MISHAGSHITAGICLEILFWHRQGSVAHLHMGGGGARGRERQTRMHFPGNLPKGGSHSKLSGAFLKEVYSFFIILGDSSERKNSKHAYLLAEESRPRGGVTVLNPYKSTGFHCVTKQLVVSRIPAPIYRCSRCRPISTLLFTTRCYAGHYRFSLLLQIRRHQHCTSRINNRHEKVEILTVFKVKQDQINLETETVWVKHVKRP